MNRDPRPRGVTLRVLDLDPVLADVQAQLPEGETAEIMFQPYAMTEHDGHVYVICSEGVGWEFSEPINWLDVHTRTAAGFGIFPKYQVKMDADEVRSLATDREIDLADLIRTFGARLESNFAVWHDTLTHPTIPAKGR